MIRRSRPAQAILALAILAAASAPSVAAPGEATMERPRKTLEILAPADVDPARLLPPPPADGGDIQRAELADVQRAYRNRSPERYAEAMWDDKHETVELFFSTLGPAFDLSRLPATARLMKVVENEQSVAANTAKRYFLRLRPWAADPTITPCDDKPNAPQRTSYPSGHATLGYSEGYVLANLMPEKAQAILVRARDYAYSRVICGDHYASDLEASHVLGTTIALGLLSSPKLSETIKAAREELRAAGLTKEGAAAQAAGR